MKTLLNPIRKVNIHHSLGISAVEKIKLFAKPIELHSVGLNNGSCSKNSHGNIECKVR